KLRAAAADINHQTLARLARHGMRDPGVDEARPFHAGDDFDRVSKSFARALEKGLFAARLAQRVGTDDTHAIGVYVAQALAKTLQTRKRPRCGFLVDTAVLLDTGGNTHHLAQAINDDELAVRVARDDHVEAVRPQVDSGENIWNGLSREALARIHGRADEGGGAHSSVVAFRPRKTSRTRRSSRPEDFGS